MKAFVEPPLPDFCITRISNALKRYAPSTVEFVHNEDDADLIVIFAHGFRKQVWYTVGRQRGKGGQSAIVQMCLRSTPNPKTDDWLNSWENAKLVWSYYDLPKLCAEDGNQANFNFYHAPLGVDSEVFQEVRQEKKYEIAIHSKGWSRESLKEVVLAAREAGKTVLNIEDPKDFGPNIEYTGIIKNDDAKLANYYSQCKYVSGLRRTEGFELPVIEGLLCGARPICYDHECYHTWFDGLAEFIPDTGSANTIPALTELFKKDPRPVNEIEKDLVKSKFSWEKIAHGFWDKII